MTQPAANLFLEGYPETLESLGYTVFDVLKKKSLDEEDAKATTVTIVDLIRKDFGGAYIPSGVRIEVARTKKAVVQEFNGNNYNALARKFHITPMRVRQIINEKRNKRLHSNR